ncbi:MAG: hypothetical protein Q7T25_15530 [Sideroxyarcus sp.]|nr:hypothetical protein [Sideroxyarcus sp.]
MPVQPGASGKQKFPLRLFAAAFVISLLTSTFGGWQAWQMHERFQKLSDKRTHVAEDIGRIMLFDEILTMSAHMTAATGEFAYETRYNQVDAQLTAVINYLKAELQQADITRHIAATDAANLALVKLERQAFALVHQGKLQQATALLNGAEYLGLKKVYASGMEKSAEAMMAFVETEQQHLQTLTDLAAAANIVGILVLLAAWLFAASYARRWAAERVEYEDMLRKSKNELEVRVEQRTADLTTANEQLLQEVAERKRVEANLAEQLEELRRWQKSTSGRENRILELKHEINQLLGSSGQPPRYPSAESQGQTEE